LFVSVNKSVNNKGFCSLEPLFCPKPSKFSGSVRVKGRISESGSLGEQGEFPFWGYVGYISDFLATPKRKKPKLSQDFLRCPAAPMPWIVSLLHAIPKEVWSTNRRFGMG